jgi:ribosomal protein S12 methylthiotransferase
MKLLMVSLGCDKNLVDSERMLGILTARGYELTDEENEAEAAVVNTCCFIEEAKKESIRQIFDLAALKESASLKALVVAGCMAQRYKDEILSEIPEIDAIVGVTGIDQIADAVDSALSGKREAIMQDISRDPVITEGKRLLTTGGHFAYLKIAEGCDKNCTYCAIPSIRGHYRSFPMEDLIREAKQLAEAGVRELILVAQETTLYGTDIYGSKMLHVLLQKLCALEGIHWIRLLYCYPEEIYPELLDVMAAEKKICHYLDLPIQHASDGVLRRMNRRTRQTELRERIQAIREKLPDIFLRTTLITGFPGETEEDHQETLSFIRDMKFDRLGVFTYSREEDTPAASFKGQVPAKTRIRRRKELMEEQQLLSYDLNRARIGTCLEAVIEGRRVEDGVYLARTAGDAPNVDGYFYIKTDRELKSGDFIRAKVTGASQYDLEGEL